MQDKLRRHIDEIFAETTPTRKSAELKEEMIQNLTDKYNDLLSEGKTNEAAYNIAVAGIGDVSGLLAELEEDAMYDKTTIEEMETANRKSAMLTAIAVMLYIISPLPLILISMWSPGMMAGQAGIPLFMLIVAAATGLLIYNNMTKPKHIKSKDTMVEEFREWQSDEKDRKRMRNAISSAVWSLIIALYFIISFMTSAWYITWVIFLVAAAIESIINIFLAAKDK